MLSWETEDNITYLTAINKRMLCDTMQYSYLLHFHIHEFVMQASKCKQNRGSAEYSFWEL